MEKNPILSELESVFRRVFKNDAISLNESTTQKDIDHWDSLTNMILMVEIEKHFQVQFNSMEVAEARKVGDLARLIENGKTVGA